MDGYKALRLGTCILSIAIMVRFLAQFMYKRKINSAARWRYDNMGDIPLLVLENLGVVLRSESYEKMLLTLQ